MTAEPPIPPAEAAPPALPERRFKAAPSAEAPEVAAENERLKIEEEERRRVEIQNALAALSATDDLHSQALQQAGNLKTLSSDKQLKVLATLAFERGAVFAVAVAEKLGDLGVLDELHDYLVRDDVYPHLDIVKKKH